MFQSRIDGFFNLSKILVFVSIRWNASICYFQSTNVKIRAKLIENLSICTQKESIAGFRITDSGPIFRVALLLEQHSIWDSYHISS